MEYLSVLAKLLLGSVMLVVYARLGGRSQVNPMSGTEVVSGMVVGAMISGSLFDNSVPVWAVGAVIAFWTLLFTLMRKLKKIQPGRGKTGGRPGGSPGRPGQARAGGVRPAQPQPD